MGGGTSSTYGLYGGGTSGRCGFIWWVVAHEARRVSEPYGAGHTYSATKRQLCPRWGALRGRGRLHTEQSSGLLLEINEA